MTDAAHPSPPSDDIALPPYRRRLLSEWGPAIHREHGDVPDEPDQN